MNLITEDDINSFGMEKWIKIHYSDEISIYDKNIRGQIANGLCKENVFDLGNYSSIAKLINDSDKFYSSKDNSLSIDKSIRKVGCLK